MVLNPALSYAFSKDISSTTIKWPRYELNILVESFVESLVKLQIQMGVLEILKGLPKPIFWYTEIILKMKNWVYLDQAGLQS